MSRTPNEKLDRDNMGEIFYTGQKAIKEKAEKIREFRKEASRKAALANKRIKRLEKNNLTDSPAYQQYLKSGGGKFGVKGKTYNEVQSEVARLNRFINSQTSTITGINKNLKDLAKNTNITYKNVKELKQKASKFFELASKVEQYLRTVEDMASAIGYQKIWEAINEYTEDNQLDLSSGESDIDSMVDAITGAIKEFEEPVEVAAGWYSLKKDDITKPKKLVMERVGANAKGRTPSDDEW